MRGSLSEAYEQSIDRSTVPGEWPSKSAVLDYQSIRSSNNHLGHWYPPPHLAISGSFLPMPSVCCPVLSVLAHPPFLFFSPPTPLLFSLPSFLPFLPPASCLFLYCFLLHYASALSRVTPTTVCKPPIH